jgi:hypothetical protein
MIHEALFLDSFKSNYDQNVNQEEEMFKSFPSFSDKYIIEEEENLDYLTYTDNSQSINDTKFTENNSNENDLLIMDDYDDLFNKLIGINETNNIIPKSDINKPLFVSNLNIHENKFKSPTINEVDEILINIENVSQNNKKMQKEPIIKIKEEKNDSNINKKNKDKPRHKPQNSPKKRKKRKKNSNIIVDTKDECFPLTPGKGIISCSNLNNDPPPSTGIPSSSDISQEGENQNGQNFNPPNREKNLKISNKYNDGSNKDENKDKNKNEEMYDYIEYINTPNDFIFKFTTKKYFVTENGKRKRVKKKRKFKPDDIRKKIKARFHKTFKNIINDNLRKAGSKELFDFLPQCFIGNVSKKTNAKCFELTYKELLSTDFTSELKNNDYKNSKVDYNKYKKNLEVLNYLEKNPEICQLSGFDLIKDRKYKDLLKIYFSSAQFENSLNQLRDEKESPEYIQEYINRARTYISFYSNVTNKDGKNNTKDENENEVEEDDEEDDNEKKH